MLKNISFIGMTAVLSLSITVPKIGSYERVDSAMPKVQAEFYVSPDGSDSGKGTISDPFRTLTAARNAVREVNDDMNGDINVYLRGGESQCRRKR